MTAPTIINRLKQAMGWDNPWQTRPQSQIKEIAIHHSATATGNTAAFENSWRNLGWRNGGYHFVILRDGSIEHNYPYTVVTNGVANHNARLLNICVVGNGEFTVEQESSLYWLILREMNTLGISIDNVLGHNEFTGTATACPGRDMKSLRKTLATLSQNSNKTHTVTKGETLTSIARQHNVTVNAIVEANNLANPNLIRVGQVLNIPSGSAPVQSFFPATSTGHPSIVNMLNAINVNSSFANRTKIARANGNSAYTGQASENEKLANLLRSGKLIKP